ncbi:MAG: glycosyltransferase family 2 protein [Weeksellaceae bacterium]|nr:glycosyltransferase family 2 protein [Weeksellaceae bacterium]
MKISVVINTYNAERYLHQVLQAVSGYDQIVICDMHSTDSTQQIAKQCGAKIVLHEKLAYADPARNFAISQADHPWVLMIDADELVPQALTKYLYNFIPKPEYAAISIPYKNYFMNRLMRSAYPDYHVRFFRKNAAYWPPTVHSRIEITGKIYKIPRSRKELAILHIANDGVQRIIHKNDTYSTLEIERRKEKKINLFHLWFSPLTWFVKYYFLKLGFLDGEKGYIFAKLKAQYKFNTLAKVYEYQQNQQKNLDTHWDAKYARAQASNHRESSTSEL